LLPVHCWIFSKGITMTKKLLITLAAFTFMVVLVFGAVAVTAPSAVGLPKAIASDVSCPVAGCTQPDGSCHAASRYPMPDGSFKMTCPQVRSCVDVSCHAFERITVAAKPSDISLNLWIVVPTVLIVGLVALVRKFS
jgi:hypothetical protein